METEYETNCTEEKKIGCYVCDAYTHENVK